MAETQKPIFGLLKKITASEERREAISLVQYLNVSTVEGLAKYSPKQLKGLGVSDNLVGLLETMLINEYALQFSTVLYNPKKEEKQPAQERQEKKRDMPKASGASPLGLYDRAPKF